MITATSKGPKYITELTDGSHFIFADGSPSQDCDGLYLRPGQILTAALAACNDITARKLLEEKGLPYDQVIVQVELDRADLDHPKFQISVDIRGDLSPEAKEAVLAQLRDCPVCRMLRAPAEVHSCLI